MLLPVQHLGDSEISQKPRDLQGWGGDAASMEEGEGGPATSQSSPLRISTSLGRGLGCAGRPEEMPLQASQQDLPVDLDS